MKNIANNLINRHVIYLWLGILAFALTFLWHYLFSPENSLLRYQYTVERFLQKGEREANQYLNEAVTAHILSVKSQQNAHEDKLMGDIFKQNLFGLFYYEGDSLVFWSKNDYVPSASSINALDRALHTEGGAVSFKEIKDIGTFEYRHKTFNINGKNILVLACIPIKWQYVTTNGQGNFAASEYIPHTFDVQQTAEPDSDKSISTFEGKVLCYLKGSKKEYDAWHDLGVTVFFISTLIFIAVFSYNLSVNMLKSYGSTFWGVSMFFITFFALFLILSSALDKSFIQFIAPTVLEEPLLKSLPYYSIYVFLGFLLSLFVNQELYPQEKLAKQLNLAVRSSLGCIFLLSILLLNFGSFYVIDKSVIFCNFQAVAFKEHYWRFFVTITMNTTLLLSCLILSNFFFNVTLALRLPKLAWLAIIDIAMITAIFIAKYYGVEKLGWESLIVTALYSAVFYLYKYFNNYHKVYVIFFWVMIFGGIHTWILDEAFYNRQTKQLHDVADKLNVNVDNTLVEYSKQLANRYYDVLNKLDFKHLNSSDSSTNSRYDGKDILLNYFNDEYLPYYYTFSCSVSMENNKVFERIDTLNTVQKIVFLKDSVSTIDESVKNTQKESEISLSSFNDGLQKAMPLTKVTSDTFKYELGFDSIHQQYMFKVTFTFPDNRWAQIYALLNLKNRKSNNLSEYFGKTTEYKSIKELKYVDYAVFHDDNVLTESNDIGYASECMRRLDIEPWNKLDTVITHFNRIEYMHYDPVSKKSLFIGTSNNYIISETPILWIIISIFNAIYVILLWVLEAYSPLEMPDIIKVKSTLNVNSSFAGALINPIGLGLVIIFPILVSFALYSYEGLKNEFSNIYKETKSNIISEDFKEKMNDIVEYPTLLESESYLYKQFSDVAKTHNCDLLFYDTYGRLKFSTNNLFFEKNIISKQMNHEVYFNLQNRSQNSIAFTDKIQNAAYQSNFIKIVVNKKNVLGYLQVPYDNIKEFSELKSNKFTWIFIIATILLFIIGLAGIYFLVNKQVKPLSQITERIKALSLHNPNDSDAGKFDPIKWHKNDEIKTLIDAINTKNAELEETYMRLAESEREGAWREMAKQVAHEIRNPLTPMKLIVQHLDILMGRNEPDFKNYVVRTNKVLLSQIASLESILTEFSNFARIPQNTQSEMVVINDLLPTFAGLFANTETEHGRPLSVTLTTVPNERYTIFADPKLLTNAFTNLLKNAMQAIPADRDGNIEINLSRQGSVAVIRIRDNGSGMTPETQAKLFSTEFTTKQYGSGIGLALTRNIVQAMNGNLTFESVEGQGTDFYVEFEIHQLETIKA